MAGKKKGKGKKLARMSEEERARYLQHRAELELEAKRRKQQLIAIFTKNKLKREEAFSRLNIAKINEQWRYILRQIKCKELYQDVEYLWKNFDRLIKTKDEIIHRLYDELKVADTDHRRLQEVHMETMDRIIGEHKSRLTRLHGVYTCELEDIESKDIAELNLLKTDMERNCKELQGIVCKQEKISANKMSITQTQNAVNLHTVNYIRDDITSDLIRQSSMKMQSLWEQMNEVISEYEKTTEAKKKQYEYLKEQDDAHQVEVAQYPKSHSQLEHAVENLKQDIETLSSKREKRVTQLKDKAKEMKRNIENIREEFGLMQLMDSLKLKKLTVISNAALKDLKRITEKGGTIQQLVEMCSDLEPLLLSLKKYSLRGTERTEFCTNNISQPFDKLENFWEQFNYVKADNILLKRECEKLSTENKRLRHRLRTYLVTVSGLPVPRPFTSISV